jgi:hypothetical protein
MLPHAETGAATAASVVTSTAAATEVPTVLTAEFIQPAPLFVIKLVVPASSPLPLLVLPTFLFGIGH